MLFQFPARNSGCSDQGTPTAVYNWSLFQFPARNSGCSDKSIRQHPHPQSGCVSIPRSEFWLFGQVVESKGTARKRYCFNSPLGILVVRTRIKKEGFQWAALRFNSPLGILVVRTKLLEAPQEHFSLCFNSPLGILVVRTLCRRLKGLTIVIVSIPRSEFWLFGLACASGTGRD